MEKNVMTFHIVFCVVLVSTTLSGSSSVSAGDTVVPLFDAATNLEPATTEDTSDALITRIADRVRDRHAREAVFHAYDHYLPFYWEERTVSLEITDRVARGGKEIVVGITSLSPLNSPNFRSFYRGINTVAEYQNNVVAKEVGRNHYQITVSSNFHENRPLKIGDSLEFEFSPFLVHPAHGRENYYGTAMLYVVGKGIRPWMGKGDRLDSLPLPDLALSGGDTTLSYQHSDEPKERFKQMAANMAPLSAQPFMLGRRLHHTDFGDGSHSEPGNPNYEEQRGKLGPGFVARSCVACHVNNGRALAPNVGALMSQSVVKLAADGQGAMHPKLGGTLQPQSTSGEPEARICLANWTQVDGKFADGTSYSLRKPTYAFQGETPGFFSVRLTPQIVGLGLLEAVSESTILALADPDDRDHDGISGRAHIVTDPETSQPRLGRFGYKAGQARLRHQIASAFNNDMGVTTTIFARLDGAATADKPELSDNDLANLTRYIATLGVSARRDLANSESLRGEQLFAAAGCSKCHLPTLVTSPHHPFAELRNQTIHPYTDLLLHDMGAGLADNLGEGRALGSEWRTAPLWSVGLTAGVSGGEAYLHDGRARTLVEAILWHGGEGEKARDAFKAMPGNDRTALVRFLQSI